MEHTEAHRTNATERYLLGELSANEADAFETHFFDCAACAADVRAGMALMDGGRRVVRPVAAPAAPVAPLARPQPRRGWWQVAAAAILAVPLTTMFLLRAPAVAPVFALSGEPVMLEAATRGADEKVVQLSSDGAGTLAFDVPADIDPPYAIRIETAGGKVAQRATLSPAAAEQQQWLVVRGADAGTYTLVISGTGPAGQPAEARIRFIVKR